MKTPPTDPRDERLSTLLRSWEVAAETPPRFSENVWRRIEARTLDRTAPNSPVTTLMNWMADLLRQRRVAAAYLALLMAVGSGAGFLRGQASSEQLALGLQGRYVQSIDPFAAHP